MSRILAAIVLVMVGMIAGLMPLSAGALSLGEIDLKSALNQPFSAEIPISSSIPGEVDGLQVEVASAQTFKQFGLDRAAFLSDFQFAVIDRGSGVAVQITSQQPVVEPFVTLLLEISWSQGRLLREYTVLLDPPVFATESVQPAVAAPTAGPVVSAPAQRETFIDTPAPQAASPATQPVAQPVAKPAESSGNSSDGRYGPVKRTDTLWTIAGRMVAGSPSVSRNQMMLAIYQANPEAFSGNINRLKAGMILRIPSANEVAIGGREATSEVRRQNEQWRGTSTARDEQQSGRLRLVPPPERDTEVAESGIETGADQQSVAGIEQAEQQERISGLEDELAESQRQLQVRDQELAALQRQLADIETLPEAELAVEEVEAPLAPDLLADTEEAEPVAEDVATTPAPVDVTPVLAERADDGSLLTNPLVYIALAIFALLAWLFARNRSKSSEPVTSRWAELDADSDQGLGEEAREATTRLRATPPGDDAFVVEEAPSLLEADDEESGVPYTEDSADGSPEDWGGLIDEGETPLERTISTDAAVNLDQADPLAESDFHMAYGLYDQAADLLTRAVESEPERKDLRMKLLEVYFIWEHQDGFLQEAKALQQQFDDADDPDWNKVLIMGKQICPDEALFAGDTALVSSTDSVDLEFGEDSGTAAIDISLDEDGDSSDELDLTGTHSLTGDEDSSMIDFVLDIEGDIESEEEATQVVGDDDLDISSGDAPTMETPTIETPAVHGAADSTLETPTIESPAVQGMDSTLETPTIETTAVQGMDSTLETPTIESPAAAAWGDDLAVGSEQTAEINLDDLDLDLSGLDDIDDDVLGGDSAIVEIHSDEAGADDEFADDSLQFEGLEEGLEDGLEDETRQQPAASLDDISDEVSMLDDLADDVDSTAEMQNIDALPESGDTVEQPTVGGGDTAEQPNLAAALDADEIRGNDELEIDDDIAVDIQSAGIEGATMTEVGTKLDLARAYIDMGDPDGARSILSEVLEEADTDQRQIAQKLLEDLVG